MATTIENYRQMAKRIGCPQDQIENFLRGGYAATPKQLLFHRYAREADGEEGPTQIALGGARGPGKSHACIAQVAHDDCQRYPGLKWLFLRAIGKSARESFEDLLDKALVQYRGYYQVSRSRIVFPNGSRILLGGFRTERDIDNYIGIEYDGIVVEELNQLASEKYDKLRGSLRTSREDWNPRAYLSFNPGGIGHAWIKKRFITPWRQGREEDTRFVFATHKDNPFLNDSYRDYLKGLTGWLGRAWREGDWDITAGQFFTTFDYNSHVEDHIRPAPRYWRYWLAMDYGYTHWNVIYLMAEDGDGNVHVVFELADRGKLVEQHVGALKQALRYWGVSESQIGSFVAGPDVFASRGIRDRNENTTIADQWKQAGWELEPANNDRVNGAAEYLRRLGDPENGIPPRLFIFDTCPRLIEGLPQLEHDPHRPEDILKVDTNDRGEGGDDFYDASRYGIMAARMPQYRKATVRRYA